jgi:hypothetical protein
LIRLGSEEEAIKILSEPETIKRIKKIPERTTSTPWIVEQGEHKMLFFFWPVGNMVFEFHVAAPKSAIIKSRSLARELMRWIFSLGAAKIITNCTRGKIANMAIKMGMTPYKTEQDIIYFEASSCP